MIIDGLFSQPIEETLWFDECRISTLHNNKIVPILTSTINTNLIDTFRQGVELTDIKYYDAGFVKIFAGEIGHQIKILSFGIENAFQSNQKTFADQSNLKPEEFINFSPTYKANINNLPIIVNNESNNILFATNGVLEPLTIRNEITFQTVNTPTHHSVYGTLLDGNTNKYNLSDRILSKDYFDNRNICNSFYEDIVFEKYKTTILPFNDIELIQEMSTTNTMTNDIIIALKNNSSGNYNNDSYIQYDQISSTTGFIFDDVRGVGVDSIAFGGFTY